jgi:hypothetical protein
MFDATLARPPAMFVNNVTVFVMGQNVRMVFTENLAENEPAVYRTSVMIPLETFVEMRAVIDTVILHMKAASDPPGEHQVN